MTTRERQAIEAFHRFTETEEDRTIYKAYGRPSETKCRIWDDIVRDYLDATKDCTDFKFLLQARPRVISRNVYFFTAGFMYVNDEGFICFKYYTPTWDYEIKIGC